MRLFRFIDKKLKQRKLKRRNRSLGGDIVLIIVLGAFGLFSLFPLVYTVVSAFKPFSEIFIFPPKLTVDNPTLDNFYDLGTLNEILRSLRIVNDDNNITIFSLIGRKDLMADSY